MAQLSTNQQNSDWSWLLDLWGCEIQRIFYIYNVPKEAVRGFHRHKQCQMGLVCLVGSVDIYVQTPEIDQHFHLNSPTQTLLLAPTDWRVMYNFSNNAMLMVLTNRTFTDTTYINRPYRVLNESYVALRKKKLSKSLDIK